MSRCVIIGSAPVGKIEGLKRRLREDDEIICADGGLYTAHRMGVKPQLVIGDFDSYSEPLPRDTEIIRLPVSKDDTDLMYCVKEGLYRGFNDFLILGATGGRLDHTYGNFGVLLYLARRGAGNLLADEYNEASVLTEGTQLISGAMGDMVSVFPFGCSQCSVSYQGLQYPLNHGMLSLEEPVGVSNRMTEEQAAITVHSGPVLVILSKEDQADTCHGG